MEYKSHGGVGILSLSTPRPSLVCFLLSHGWLSDFNVEHKEYNGCNPEDQGPRSARRYISMQQRLFQFHQMGVFVERIIWGPYWCGIDREE